MRCEQLTLELYETVVHLRKLERIARGTHRPTEAQRHALAQADGHVETALQQVRDRLFTTRPFTDERGAE